jgi:hypothetical protein
MADQNTNKECVSLILTKDLNMKVCAKMTPKNLWKEEKRRRRNIIAQML